MNLCALFSSPANDHWNLSMLVQVLVLNGVRNDSASVQTTSGVSSLRQLKLKAHMIT
jgi:hypothetical protein